MVQPHLCGKLEFKVPIPPFNWISGGMVYRRELLTDSQCKSHLLHYGAGELGPIITNYPLWETILEEDFVDQHFVAFLSGGLF